jgi:hypothetical protein
MSSIRASYKGRIGANGRSVLDGRSAIMIVKTDHPLGMIPAANAYDPSAASPE